MVDIDEKDRLLFAARLRAWEARPGPRVGDFVRRLDGTLRRFTWRHAEGLQTTYVWRSGYDAGKPADASFHMFDDGTMSFSGSLDNLIPWNRLVLSQEPDREGPVWFFHHDFPAGHSAVYFPLPCRVYRELSPEEVSDDETGQGSGAAQPVQVAPERNHG